MHVAVHEQALIDLTKFCMGQDAAFDPDASSSAQEIFCGDSRCQCGQPACSCGPQGQCEYVRNYGKLVSQNLTLQQSPTRQQN